MRYVSLFSGIEAASVAWEGAGGLGWTPLAFAEVDPFASALLAGRYPSVPNHGDVTAFDWSVYRGACDVLVGGSPCQSFSVAGLRGSLQDDRGNLALAFCRITHAINPAYVVYENVPGILSTADNAFGCLLAGLVGSDAALESGLERARGGRWPDAGMVIGPQRSAAWRVLDAQGAVPQRRRRVFVVSCRVSDGVNPGAVLFEPEADLVGCLGNWERGGSLFPVRDRVPGHPAPGREAPAHVAAGLTRGADSSGGAGGYAGRRREDDVNLVAGTLNSAGNNGGFRTEPGEHLIGVQVGLGADGQTARSLNAGTQAGRRDDASVETFVVAPPPPAQGTYWNGQDVTDTLDVSKLKKQQMMPEKNRFAAVLVPPQTADVAHALRADGFDATEDGTGRGTPLVPVEIREDNPNGIAGTFQNTGQGWWNESPVATAVRTPKGSGSLEANVVAQPIPIDMRQASRGGTMTNNRGEDVSSGGAPGMGICEPGDPAPSVSLSHPPAVAYPVVPDPVVLCQNGSDVQVSDTPGTLAASQARQTSGDVIAFYSTESHSSGDNRDLSPTLKVGSGLGIPSAPAVAYSTKLQNTTSNGAGKFYEDYTAGLDANSPPPVVAYISPRIIKNQHGDSSNQVGIKADGVSDCLGTDGPGAIAFAQNQRDEIRTMDVSGALAAEPGMKQQTYVATPIPEAEHGTDDQANAGQILRRVRDEIGEEAFAEWGLGMLYFLQSAEVLQREVHGQELRRSPDEDRSVVGDGPLPRAKDLPARAVREVRETQRPRRGSQGRELPEQLAAELAAVVPGLPHQKAQAERLLHGLWEAGEGIGVLREALSAVQANRRSIEGPDAAAADVPGVREAGERGGPVRQALHADEAGKAAHLITSDQTRKEVPGSMAVRRLTPV